MSFPNGSSAGLHGISIQTLKDLTAKSNGQTGLNFLRALTNLVNVILEGKVPFELRSYFFGAKLIALKKPDRGLRPIAVRKRCRIPCQTKRFGNLFQPETFRHIFLPKHPPPCFCRNVRNPPNHVKQNMEIDK